MSHAAPKKLNLDSQRKLDAVAPMIFFAGVGGGAALIAATWLLGDAERARLAYLTAFCFWLTISLGALFFVVIQHLTRAGWSVVIRRIAEVMAMNVFTMAVLAIPLLWNVEDIYHHWAHPAAHGYDEVLEWKQGWLNPTAFNARVVVYFILWIGIAYYHWSRSVRQDATGDRAITLRVQSISGIWVILLSLLFTFAAFDLVMSLDPHWYSTMFGVMFFAGAFLGFFATIILICRVLHVTGIIGMDVITIEHLHDLGKWLFAFTFFWGYIAFSQYMLIWYGSIPEEAQWYARRGATGNYPEYDGMTWWTRLSVALLLGHLFIPYAALLTRFTKRMPTYLTVVAFWLFVFHYIDLYWQIMPAINHTHELENGLTPHPPGVITEVLMWAGVGAVWIGALARFASTNALVPTGDPRLQESLAFENF